jgi:hypothetical protein
VVRNPQEYDRIGGPGATSGAEKRGKELGLETKNAIPRSWGNFAIDDTIKQINQLTVFPGVGIKFAVSIDQDELNRTS